jgi:hypothetical protein
MNASDANSLWQAHRQKFMLGIKQSGDQKNGTSNTKSGMKTFAKSFKRMNAEAYLRYLRQLYFGENFVTKEGVGKVRYSIIIIENSNILTNNKCCDFCKYFLKG